MKIARRVLRASMKVAKRIEEHPEQHSFYGGNKNSSQKCFLVMLGEELKFEAPVVSYYAEVDRTFLDRTGHRIAYECDDGRYSLVPPATVASNLRKWVSETCAAQGTRL